MRKWAACMGMILCLAGCGESAIINKIKLAQTISYDLDGEGIKSTILFPLFNKKEEVRIIPMDITSDNFYDILPKMNTKSNYSVEYGQMKMVLLGNEFAKKGVEAIVQSFFRDPELGTWLQLGVAEGEASAILKTRDKSQIPYFIYGLIDHNREKGNLPDSSLHTFLNTYYGEGRDPFLPYIKMDREDIKLDGLALFRHDKYVTHISLKDTFLLKAMLGKSKKGEYMAPFPTGEGEGSNPYLLLQNIHSRVTYDANKLTPVPSVTIHVKLAAQVKDVPEPIMSENPEQKRALENQLASYFTDQLNRLIAFFKENRVDPVGFGEHFRRKFKAFQEKQFQEAYPRMETQVDVKVDLTMTSVGE